VFNCIHDLGLRFRCIYVNRHHMRHAEFNR
jgi:hypothetical protein